MAIGAAAAAVPFEVLQAPRNATLPAGKSIQVRVTFSPELRGPASGTLVIDSSDADHPETVISLQGSGR